MPLDKNDQSRRKPLPFAIFSFDNQKRIGIGSSSLFFSSFLFWFSLGFPSLSLALFPFDFNTPPLPLFLSPIYLYYYYYVFFLLESVGVGGGGGVSQSPPQAPLSATRKAAVMQPASSCFSCSMPHGRPSTLPPAAMWRLVPRFCKFFLKNVKFQKFQNSTKFD